MKESEDIVCNIFAFFRMFIFNCHNHLNLRPSSFSYVMICHKDIIIFFEISIFVVRMLLLNVYNIAKEGNVNKYSCSKGGDLTFII